MGVLYSHLSVAVVLIFICFAITPTCHVVGQRNDACFSVLGYLCGSKCDSSWFHIGEVGDVLIGRHQVGDWLWESLIRVLCQDPCILDSRQGEGSWQLIEFWFRCPVPISLGPSSVGEVDRYCSPAAGGKCWGYSAVTWTGKALLREPFCPNAPFHEWEVLCEALKETSCTAGKNIETSATHCNTRFFCVFLNFGIFIVRKGSHQRHIIYFLTDEDGGK